MSQKNEIQTHPEILELVHLSSSLNKSATELRRSWDDKKSEEFYSNLYFPLEAKINEYINATNESLMKIQSAEKLANSLLSPLSGVGYQTRNYRWLSFNDVVFVGRREFLKIFNLDGWG